MEDELHPPWVHLEARPWTAIGPGAREKVVDLGDRRLRLLELTDAFDEAGWCHKAHWGILLEGRMALMLPGERISLQEGDALTIEAGEEHKHRAHIAPGGRALLFLIEPLEDQPTQR